MHKSCAEQTRNKLPQSLFRALCMHIYDILSMRASSREFVPSLFRAVFMHIYDALCMSAILVGDQENRLKSPSCRKYAYIMRGTNSEQTPAWRPTCSICRKYAYIMRGTNSGGVCSEFVPCMIYAYLRCLCMSAYFPDPRPERPICINHCKYA